MSNRVKAILDASKANSPLSVPAAHTALLLMDYQKLIVPAIGDTGPRIVSIAGGLRDWAVSRSIPVHHCLVDTRPGSKPIASMKMAERWSVYEEKLGAHPELGEEIAELAPPAGSELEKTFRRQPGLVSALVSDGLEDEFKRRQVRSLVLGGISTSGCVMSTVRAATDKGYLVTVVEDACADPVPGMHEMLADYAFTATAHVATFEEFRDAWGNDS